MSINHSYSFVFVKDLNIFWHIKSKYNISTFYCIVEQWFNSELSSMERVPLKVSLGAGKKT